MREMERVGKSWKINNCARWMSEPNPQNEGFFEWVNIRKDMKVEKIMKCKNCHILFEQMKKDKARIKALEKRITELNPYESFNTRPKKKVR